MENNFFCEICGLGYKCKRKLVLHKKKHEKNYFKERVYSCNICVVSFSGSKALKTHNSSCHSEDELNICNFCEFFFSKSSNLKFHIKSCKKGNSLLSSSEEHKNTHENFYCELCKKKFGIF